MRNEHIAFSNTRNLVDNAERICNDIETGEILWDDANLYSNQLKRTIDAIKKMGYVDIGTDSYSSVWARRIPKYEYFYKKSLYYNELWSVTDWILHVLRQHNPNNLNYNMKNVNSFIAGLLSRDLIKPMEREILKIIRGTISTRMLVSLFDNVRYRTSNFTIINESFYNPFDDDLYADDRKSIIDDIDVIDTRKERDLIKKIKVYNNASKIGGVKYVNGKVYATRSFYAGDIIEYAPVRLLNSDDLYSSSVRKITFPLDPARGIFGVPFGIGSIARNEAETGIEGNIDYEYTSIDADHIKIYATENILSGAELIFVSNNKFENIQSFDRYHSDLGNKVLEISVE